MSASVALKAKNTPHPPAQSGAAKLSPSTAFPPTRTGQMGKSVSISATASTITPNGTRPPPSFQTARMASSVLKATPPTTSASPTGTNRIFRYGANRQPRKPPFGFGTQKSAGQPLATVEEREDWVVKLMGEIG